MKCIVFAALAAMTITAHAESKAVYAGDGRWACSGNSVGCAQIDNNNRQRERERQYESDRNQDRANAYVEQQRRKEQERRNEQYRDR
jgi:Ni/Co efflux regulator RcnB